MSCALRIVEGLNDGSVVMDAADPCTDSAISFVAALLRPVYVPAAERFNRPVMRCE